MSSLFDLLSRQTPTLQVRKGLVVLDLQNDFLSPEGKLHVRETGFLEPLAKLVTTFREFGDVIWVRSQFESTRPIDGPDADGDVVIAGGSSGKEVKVQSVDDLEGSRKKLKKSKQAKATTSSTSNHDREDDEELFLNRTSEREPCCLRGSHGAGYFPSVLPLIHETDMQMIKTHYSAFSSTSLLLTLRGKLITELFICGCITNLSVYATAMDAARYGIRVTLVNDCLGYRRQLNHETALKQLHDIMEASNLNSTEVIQALRGPQTGTVDDELVFGEPGQKHSDANAIEADSDDSDDFDEEEVQKPIPSRLFDRRVEPRSIRPSNKYSSHVLAAMRERKASFEHAKPSSTHRSDATEQAESSSRQPARRAGERCNDTFTQESSGDSGKLISHDSSNGKSRLHLERQFVSSVDASHAKQTAPPAATKSTTSGTTTVAEIEGMMERATLDDTRPRTGALSGTPLFGDDKETESAGSRISYDLLPPELAETVFDKLNDEVDWQKMYHLIGEVPRLVCCQGEMDSEDGSMPIYRHPSDHIIPLQKWTQTVDMVRRAAELAVGHPLNHVLIQLYRSGTDFISEHSDKTLDIVPGSNIVNVSFGAQRTMRLRTKRGAQTSEPNGARTTYRVPMPHNSMIVMSLKTNAQYLHGINADKRPRCELVESEEAFGGQRISCTFRQIGTFISKDSELIWGQGAVGKTKQEAREVINGDFDESEKMVRAFGAENAASTIEWQQIYGQGFDVLHLKAIQGQRAAAPAV